MDREKRKELTNSYTSRKKTGAVIAICCEASGKRLLISVPDLKGYENRFLFSQQIDSPVHEKLRKDWSQFGAGSFTLDVLETLEKGEDQTDRDFGESLKILLEIHMDKLDGETLY
jgi:hypothetical protein